MKKIISLIALLLALILPMGSLAEIHPLPVDQSGGYPVSKDNLTGNSDYDYEYKDESIHVTVTSGKYKKQNVMCIRVKIEDPTQLRTAMTNDNYDEKVYAQVKAIAKKKNAVLALNGDFFKYEEHYGYLVREGVLYRDRASADHDILLIDEQGDFHVVPTPTDDAIHSFVQELEGQGHTVINSFNFGPTLCMDGKALENINTSIYQGRYKMMRLAIGQLGPLEYAVYWCYGLSDATKGLSLPDFAAYIAEVTPEVQVAYNLDGGGSTRIVLLDKELHKNPGRRDICDIVYFCSASDALGSERAK